MTSVFTQIGVILLYVLVGFVAGKTRLISPEQRQYLTRLCSNLILPFTVLSASSRELGARDMEQLLLATALMLAVIGGTTAVCLAVHRIRKTPAPMRAATTSLLTYPNLTFLGLPLCLALFGDLAILYNVSGMLVFNVLFFSVQYSLFTGEKFRLKNLLTPAMVSTVILIVMLLARLRFPAPVQTVVQSIGSMITPLSLIIIGVMLAENGLLSVLKEKRAYGIVLLRNLLIPLLAMLLLTLLPLDSQARICVLVYLATPCATLTVIYSIRSDMETHLCASTVLLSTIAFAATLPLIAALGSACL